MEALVALLQSGEAGALATVLQVSGSAPQTPGARLLLRADGSAVGTVGGGALERRVLEALRGVLSEDVTAPPRVLSCDLGRDLGMCCGGRMDIFIEPIAARPRLSIFGAGHVAKPTAALALGSGFEVVVVDEREEWNTEDRFPGCRRELQDAGSHLRQTSPGQRDWLLIVTHDHRLDEEALRLALRGGARYIGLVGSRGKVYKLLQRIAAREGTLDLSRLYAPVGLDLGAVTPDELALCIVGELVALRRQGLARGHATATRDSRLAQMLAEVAPPAAADALGHEVPGRGDASRVRGVAVG